MDYLFALTPYHVGVLCIAVYVLCYWILVVTFVKETGPAEEPPLPDEHPHLEEATRAIDQLSEAYLAQVETTVDSQILEVSHD